MGMIKTLGAATVVPGTPTPAIFAAANTPFTVFSIASVSWSAGVMTVTLTTALPSNGFNSNSQVIAGNVAPGPNVAGGQQVMLWGFATYLDLNGVPVTVRSNDGNKSFTFYYSNPNNYSGTDTGKAAACPFQHYRAIRLEAGQSNGTDKIYVGDNHVSSSRYFKALTLASQVAAALPIDSGAVIIDNMPVERVCIDGTMNTDTVQVTLIY